MKAYSQFLRELPSKQVVIAFGDFQPPTTSHELLIKTVSNLATEQKSAQFIYTSLTEDSKKNPLPADRKIYFLKRMFSEANFRTAGDLLQAAKELNEKYNSIVLVTGSDLVQEYQKLLEKNNGKLFNFAKIAVVSSGTLDADAESNVSKIREAVKKGDQSTFKESLPNTLTTLDSKRLMNEMRVGMGLELIKEQVKLPTDWLRESYFRGELFQLGDIVETDNTIYRIQKLGSNHLLLQNEQGNLVSKWVRDVIVSQKPFNFQGKITEMKFTATDKIKVARIIANALGVIDVEKTSSAEQLVNNALRKVRNKPMRPEYADVIQHMLLTAREAGIEYDEKLVPKKAEVAAENHNPKHKYWSDKAKEIKDKQQKDKMKMAEDVIDEVSSELLDRYKTKAKKSADDLASKGQYKQSNDRTLNVMKATGKQIEKTTAGIKKALNREGYQSHSGPSHGHAYGGSGFGKRPREDDEYHVPDPVAKDHPHAVHINGKKWKTFGSESHASNVAKKIKNATVHKEEVDLDEDIKKEYDSLKKNHDIKSLRGLIKTQHRIIDTSEFKTKDHAISHYLRSKHGDKKVAAAFGLKEEQLDEISQKLAGDYYGAATKKHIDKVGIKPDMYNRIEKDMGKQRKAGVDRALDRVTGTRKTNEEHEQIQEKAIHKPEHGFSDGSDVLKFSDYARLHNVTQTQPDVEVATSNYSHSQKTKYRLESVEYEDLNEEDFDEEISQIEDLQHIIDAYDDSELVIIDEDTGEVLEEVDAVTEDALNEVLGRMERIRRKQRFARTKSKREIRTKIALKKTSSMPVLNKRAKRLAITMIKKRMLRKDPSKASVQEKERVEKFLSARPQLVQRLSRRLVPRVRQVEKARLRGHKYNQSSVGKS